jgi:hypothetical protein
LVIAKNGKLTELGPANELIAKALGKTCHGLEVGCPVLMHPFKKLPRPKGLFTQAFHPALELLAREP